MKKRSSDKYDTKEIIGSDLKSELASAKPRVPDRRPSGDAARADAPAGSRYVKRKSPIKLVTGTAALLAVILIIVYMCARAFGGSEVYRVTDNIAGKFWAAFDGSCGLNDTVEPGSVVSVDTLGKRLIVLYEDSTAVYSASGDRLFSSQHTYAQPVCAVSAGRAAIYDLASGRYFIQDESSELVNCENSGKLLCVGVGADGSCAVAGDSDSAQSELIVYDGKHNAVLDWKCSSGYISAVALSPDGSTFAAASVGTDGVELLSRVTIFSSDSAEPEAVFEYPGEAVFRLDFSEDDKAVAVGTGMRSVIDISKKEKTDKPFGTCKLADYCADDSGRAIAGFWNFGNETDSVVRAYASDGSALFEKEFDGKVKSVSCSGSGFAALVDDTVWCFNKNGDVTGEHIFGGDARSIAVGGRFVYVLSLGSVSCRHMYESSDINSAATSSDSAR